MLDKHTRARTLLGELLALVAALGAQQRRMQLQRQRREALRPRQIPRAECTYADIPVRTNSLRAAGRRRGEVTDQARDMSHWASFIG